MLHSCHDDASRFIYLLAKPGCNYLEQEDFIPLLQVRTEEITGQWLIEYLIDDSREIHFISHRKFNSI